MTEQARIYGKVLYELQIPEDMVQETGRIFKENPQLTTLLNDPTVQAGKKEKYNWKNMERTGIFLPLYLLF